ncbi:MAG: hypothetical protein U0350_27720 [Caldilineaceae bacterium]
MKLLTAVSTQCRIIVKFARSIVIGGADMLPTRFLSSQSASPRFGVRQLFGLGLCFTLLLSLTHASAGPTPFWGVVHAAIPICTNSVSAGVYLDVNADGLREPTEAFLSGGIQIMNSAGLTVSTFESPNGLFVLNDLPCDVYTVYHNGDYVGKLLVDEVMGEILIELPKTNLIRHIFIPIIN